MRAVSLLADSVAVAEGKLYVQGGGWNAITTTTLPARHPRLGIAILLSVPFSETNVPHKFDLRIEDPDGHPIPLGDAPPGTTPDGKARRLGGPLLIGRPALLGTGEDQMVPIAANLDGLLFETAGTYRVMLSVDDEDIESAPFSINPLPQMTPVIR